MIKYIIYVKGEEKPFHQFESSYSFEKNKNIEDVFYVKKEGKLHSLTIENINTHDIKEDEHIIRIDCRFNKLFS